MIGSRVLCSAALLVTCGVAIATDRLPWLAIIGLVGLVAHFLLAGAMWRALASLWPIVFFALILTVVQRAGGIVSWVMPAKTIDVFLLISGAIRLLPWPELLRRARPGSRGFALVLFLIIVHHFVSILGRESKRVLLARRVAAPFVRGSGWFRSLTWSVAAIFRRSLERAERFYAAQLLRGMDG